MYKNEVKYDFSDFPHIQLNVISIWQNTLIETLVISKKEILKEEDDFGH